MPTLLDVVAPEYRLGDIAHRGANGTIAQLPCFAATAHMLAGTMTTAAAWCSPAVDSVTATTATMTRAACWQASPHTPTCDNR